MPSGPKQAPARKEALVSKGAPTTAASAFWRPRLFGRRMKMRTPEKRGVSKEFAGSYLVDHSPEYADRTKAGRLATPPAFGH